MFKFNKREAGQLSLIACSAIIIAISPANSKFFHLKLATLIAMEGTFSKVPSIAAATVPEQKISVPKFGPWFIPYSTRSGL